MPAHWNRRAICNSLLSTSTASVLASNTAWRRQGCCISSIHGLCSSLRWRHSDVSVKCLSTPNMRFAWQYALLGSCLLFHPSILQACELKQVHQKLLVPVQLLSACLSVCLKPHCCWMLLLVLLEAMMTLLLLLLLLLNEWQCVEQTRICLGLRAGL